MLLMRATKLATKLEVEEEEISELTQQACSEYRAACDFDRLKKAVVSHGRMLGDRIIAHIPAVAKQLQFEECVLLLAQAKKHFKVVQRSGMQSSRMDQLVDEKQCEQDAQRLAKVRKPCKQVATLAIMVAEENKQAAKSKLRKKEFSLALQLAKNAQQAYEWVEKVQAQAPSANVGAVADDERRDAGASLLPETRSGASMRMRRRRAGAGKDDNGISDLKHWIKVVQQQDIEKGFLERLYNAHLVRYESDPELSSSPTPGSSSSTALLSLPFEARVTFLLALARTAYSQLLEVGARQYKLRAVRAIVQQLRMLHFDDTDVGEDEQEEKGKAGDEEKQEEAEEPGAWGLGMQDAEEKEEAAREREDWLQSVRQLATRCVMVHQTVVDSNHTVSSHAHGLLSDERAQQLIEEAQAGVGSAFEALLVALFTPTSESQLPSQQRQRRQQQLVLVSEALEAASECADRLRTLVHAEKQLLDGAFEQRVREAATAEGTMRNELEGVDALLDQAEATVAQFPKQEAKNPQNLKDAVHHHLKDEVHSYHKAAVHALASLAAVRRRERGFLVFLDSNANIDHALADGHEDGGSANPLPRLPFHLHSPPPLPSSTLPRLPFRVSSQELLERDLARADGKLAAIVKEAYDALCTVRLEKSDRERLFRKQQEAAERARLDDEILGDAREMCEECELMVAHGLYGLGSDPGVKEGVTRARQLLKVAELEVGMRSGVNISSTEAMEKALATMRDMCEQAVEQARSAVQVVRAEQQRLETAQRERLQHERELRVAMRDGEFAEAVGLLDEAKGSMQRSIFSAELSSHPNVIARVAEAEAAIKDADALLARPMETKYGETMHLMEQTYREKLTASLDCCARALAVVQDRMALLQSELDARIAKDEEVRAELKAGACAQAAEFVAGVEKDVATGDVSLAKVEHLSALRAQVHIDHLLHAACFVWHIAHFSSFLLFLRPWQAVLLSLIASAAPYPPTRAKQSTLPTSSQHSPSRLRVVSRWQRLHTRPAKRKVPVSQRSAASVSRIHRDSMSGESNESPCRKQCASAQVAMQPWQKPQG
jgi:hypothetical protein